MLQTNEILNIQKDILFDTKRNVTWNPATSDAGSHNILGYIHIGPLWEIYPNDGRNSFIG